MEMTSGLWVMTVIAVCAAWGTFGYFILSVKNEYIAYLVEQAEEKQWTP